MNLLNTATQYSFFQCDATTAWSLALSAAASAAYIGFFARFLFSKWSKQALTRILQLKLVLLVLLRSDVDRSA
jgi:hypothetical protein